MNIFFSFLKHISKIMSLNICISKYICPQTNYFKAKNVLVIWKGQQLINSYVLIWALVQKAVLPMLELPDVLKAFTSQIPGQLINHFHNFQ